MSLGNLYIISAPSGAGKTSLVKQLLTETDRLTVSVSHTTRPPRAGEMHGADYFFVNAAEFQDMIAAGAFLEHARVFDNFYGTAAQTVQNYLAQDLDVILEIDWQGAAQVRQKLPDCRTIFILPPSLDVLRQRLRQRAQDSAEVVERRMRDAAAEIRHVDEYDYIVVNDDFQTALGQLKNIILANRLTRARQRRQLEYLLENLLN